MAELIENWRTQIRKGYLELCLLTLIETHKRIYGFDLLEKLSQLGLPLKEGTLYPILNRMTSDGILQSTWETEKLRGAPRKFYSLTRAGTALLSSMSEEYQRMVEILEKAKNGKDLV